MSRKLGGFMILLQFARLSVDELVTHGLQLLVLYSLHFNALILDAWGSVDNNRGDESAARFHRVNCAKFVTHGE